MENRVAGVCALIAFAMCLGIGAFEARNPFVTTVGRALVAMLGAYVVGYMVGWAAERMFADRDQTLEKKSEPVEQTGADGR
jgi:NhaP-type Na+/H+ or K+/H+ antiporter